MGNISKDINSRFPSNKVKVLINILYTANYITGIQNEFFKPFGLSPQQFNVLRILNGAYEPLKVQTIKSRMIDRSPNITRLMDKLHSKGFIERIACPTDRRVVHITITDAGKDLLDNISDKLPDDILKHLSEAEAEQLSMLLDKIR